MPDNQTIIIVAVFLSPIIGLVYGFSVYTALGRTEDALRCPDVLAALAFGRNTMEIIADIAIAAAIIPPMAVSGLALVLRPISLINSRLLVAGQIIGRADSRCARHRDIAEDRVPAPKEKGTARQYETRSTVIQP